jgi:hypothetical protein
MNPLGVRGLYLGNSMYRIHGTDAPWTIGTAVSKGCIRLYNQDVLDLYPRVNVGAKVTVTYQTFTTSGVAATPSAPALPSAVSSLSKATPKSIGSFLFGEEEPARPTRRAAPRAKAKSKAAAPSKRAAPEARQSDQKADQKAAASAAIGPAPAPASSATPAVIETAAPRAVAE